MKQSELEKNYWKFRYQYGGTLRTVRRGRKFRPLSTKSSVHLVFKAEKKNLRRGLRSPAGHQICRNIIKLYAKKFYVKIEQQAICQDHIHLMIRLSKRSLGQHFFRVVAGQIAQQFAKNNMIVTDTPKDSKVNGGLGRVAKRLWKHRPFTRVALGAFGHRIVAAYVRLNEKEARGEIAYSKHRLKGLSSSEWQLLWS